MMKHRLVRKIVAIFLLLALSLSAWGVAPVQAATLTVTNANDSGSGSLRATIAAAAPGDTITFAGDYTIRLASVLTIDKDLTIDGAGRSVTLSGDTDGDGGADVQVMVVNTVVTAALNHLTITKGVAESGGGIYNYGALSVTDSTFSGNSATFGGGIYNYGALSVTDSTFSGNSVSFGGGIYNYYTSTLTVTDGTFSGNSAQRGGGILNNGTLSVTDSTFSGNSATWDGGGIENYGGTLSVTDSTFSGNSAWDGGGIYNLANGTCASPPAAIIANSTFSGNSAIRGGGIYNAEGVISLLFNTITASPSGGGVRSFNNSLACTKAGSNIIAGNTGYDLSADSTAPRFDSLGYNLVGVAGTNVDFSQEFNQTGDQVNVADPMLGSLANNGGPTQTRALLPGSPAINAGNDAACAASPINGKDQRGVTRPQGSHCDIGAYEYHTDYAKPTASGAGDCSSWTNACTLQNALETIIPGDEIWVMAGTHKPTSGTDRNATFQLKNGAAVYGGFAGTETARNQRDPAANVTILSGDLNGDDTGLANNGENSYHVVTGATGATLDGFTIMGGNANGPNCPGMACGGGMFNESSSPTLKNVTFSGNSAVLGGGMSNYSSNPAVTNVTFSGNSATYGGGMHNYYSNPTVTNATFSGNSAEKGGGMYNDFNNPTLTNVTISGNSADKGGGGIFDYSSSTTLKNVLIANSTSGGDCVLSSSTLNAASANNLIEDSANACGLTHGSNGNIIGSDPLLGSFGNYGGSTQTFPLLPGSPAIDAGTNTGCLAIDQRGTARPVDGDLNGTASCDIGAYELVTGKKTFNSQATYDGWVLESSETSGKGGTKNNKATTLYLGDDASNKQYRSILSFSTSGIPASAHITRVTLTVKRSGVVGGGNPIKTFKGILVDIKKGNFGTATLALGDFKATASKTYGPFKPALFGGWYSIDLTSGQTYLNRSGNTQIRLRFKLDDNNNSIANYLKLYSGNAPTASRPQLVVEYYVP